MSCLKQHKSEHIYCRQDAKEYLKCRMDRWVGCQSLLHLSFSPKNVMFTISRELMAREDYKRLGYHENNSTDKRDS